MKKEEKEEEEKEKKVKKEKTKKVEKEEKKVKKVKKVKKLKKKNIIILICVLLVVVLFSVLGYFLYDKLLLKNIKNSYSEFVKTTRDTYLYDNNGQKIGTISKDITLQLASIKNITNKNKYFKIKDTDYKIYYRHIKKVKKNEQTTTKNYISYNKNIETNKKVELLKDNKKVITLNNGINSPIEYVKDNKYYVNFLNETYSIKKTNQIKEIDKENTKDKEAEYVSVINYNVIEENCSNYECTTIANVKEQINKLKENKYNFITKDEYLLFVNNAIRLKENAVLLTINSLNDNVKNIIKELNVPIEHIEEKDNLKFVSTNRKTEKNGDKNSLNKYDVKSYSTANSILRMAKGEEVFEADPTYNRNGQKIAVLNYHFFYDPTTGDSCDEVICLTKQKFEDHLKYFKDNGFKTLTMSEFVRWYNGEIDLPPKSVLITVDDGAKGTGAHNGNILIPLLEKYKLHATLFLIAGWWKIDNYRSPYLDIQSHTYDMHKIGSCGRGQLVCANYETAKNDIKTSLDIIGNNDSFCYPFYHYNNTSIQVLKDLGFKIAFAGGNVKASRSSNRYAIPRYPIQSDVTLNDIIRIVN